MKTDLSHLDSHRLHHGDYGTKDGETFGFFVFCNGRRQVHAMAVDGTETGWEHVSVSVIYRNTNGKFSHPMPTWEEMCMVKNAFWEPSECVVQFHPAEEDYVNIKENCLHLWRCVNAEFPMPPKICV